MKNQSMKQALLAAMLVTAPGLVYAQSTTTPPAGQRPSPMPSATVPAPQATSTPAAPTSAPGARRASSIIGADIYNDENREVGEVHDLMVSTGPTIAVLSVGGFLGIGERYVAVPLSDLRWNNDRERWVLPGATVESLKARPAFSYPERG